MLSMYLLQSWFNLSDEEIEDAIYDSYPFRKFSHIDFYKEQVPDATTLLHFRYLLEEKLLCQKIFDDIRVRLDKVCLLMHGGTDSRCNDYICANVNEEQRRIVDFVCKRELAHVFKSGARWGVLQSCVTRVMR